jgi:1-acyl-sn-glycerol-3-phosphate acyltransferase
MKVGSVFVYRLAVGFFDVVFRFTGGLKGIDVQNVPATGGAIIAPIHLSHLDPPALAATMRHRRLLAMAKEELWDNKIFGWLIGQIGAFPVKRGEGDTESIRKAMAVLEAGNTLLVFPEGTRGDAVTMLPIARGVAMLAKKTGVPIVPVGIVGTHIVMPAGKKERGKHRITVAYGRPFTYEEVATGKNERENREIFARELERRILELCHAHGLPIRSGGSETDSQTPAAPERTAEAQPSG